MKIRNAMCIFALFSIMALFFCFGVVANAAESGETETFTYSLSYEVPSNYTSNFIGMGHSEIGTTENHYILSYRNNYNDMYRNMHDALNYKLSM